MLLLSQNRFTWLPVPSGANAVPQKGANLMKLTGRRWNMVCLALLGVLLFSSCASSPQGTVQTASADSSAEEQTAPGEDETLRDQLI